MPVNAGPEYSAAEKKYLAARNKEEKIAALENMIRKAPKHKGTEHLLADLRKRLKKLKSEAGGKASAKQKFSIRKDGAAQICIVGLTNSGKSTLLNKLTNARTKVANYPYTTKDPIVGMMNYNDVQLQIIEIPSTFTSELISIIMTCDEIIAIVDKNSKDDQWKILNAIFLKNNINQNKVIWLWTNKDDLDIDSLKEKIWNVLKLIRVYTKSPSKPKKLPAIALNPGSTIQNLAERIHRDFLKDFKFARVFNDTKFSGQKVGLDYRLKDMDVVEIHTD